MPADDSLTVIVPALDEEAGLPESVAMVLDVVPRSFERYEVLIFDDGSTDGTGRIADELAAANPHVRAFHHPRPLGLGGVLRRGWDMASMRRAIWVDGQGVTAPEALAAILAARHEADIVVPYASNQGDRSAGRRWIAKAFRALLNAAFGLDLHQYTHLVLCDPAVVRSLRLRSRSHALQAEAVVKLIKTGCSYVQVGVEDRFAANGRKSKAFKISNVVGVASAVLWTWWDVSIARSLVEERRPALGLAPERGREARQGTR